MKKYFKIFVISLFLWCLLYFIPAIKPIFNPDNFILDLMYVTNYILQSDKSINDEIVIVDIDNDSLWLLERPDYLAELVELIAEKGKAEIIGLDIQFDDLKHPEPKKPFLKDMSLSCPYKEAIHPLEMKLACIIDTDAVSNVVLVSTVKKNKGKLEILNPVNSLKEAAWAIGSAEIPLEKGDQNHHKASVYHTDSKNDFSYSFPILIAAYIKGEPSLNDDLLRIGKQKINIYRSSEGFISFIPRLLGPSHMYKYVTTANLLDKKHNSKYYEKLFKGKIVLIGSSSELLNDKKNTPYTNFYKNTIYNGEMPGVEFHANSVYSLLHNQVYYYAPIWINVIAAFVVLLVCSVLILHFKSSYSFVLNIFLAIIVYIIAFMLFKYYFIIVSAGTIITVILLTIPLAYIYRYLSVDKLFGRYVSPDVSDLIWKNKDQIMLKGEKKFATIMFSDIRGFTSLSEKADPEQVLEILNEYFERMANVIYKTNGNLNKFMGDGLMVLYGAPISDKDSQTDAKNAVYAAQLMLEEVELLNSKWASEGKNLKIAIGIGIHSGEIIAGNIGSSKRIEYSAIGDSVNLASRLESSNKEFNTNILISENTYKLVENDFNFKYLAAIKVKGRLQEVKIFTINNEKDIES